MIDAASFRLNLFNWVVDSAGFLRIGTLRRDGRSGNENTAAKSNLFVQQYGYIRAFYVGVQIDASRTYEYLVLEAEILAVLACFGSQQYGRWGSCQLAGGGWQMAGDWWRVADGGQ